MSNKTDEIVREEGELLDDIIESYNSKADPVTDILGPDIKSHPREWEKAIKNLKDEGVEIIDQQLNMLSKVKDFLKDPLEQPLEAVETSFVIYNAFIVGRINSIIDAVKEIFDMITLVCQGLIALKVKAIDMAQNLTSYFSLLLEMIENQIETIANIFSKENLNALFAFFKKCRIMALTLPAKLFSWISEGVEMPNLDKIAYYMGYIIGFIIQIILEILFTGGAKTVADAFANWQNL
jgi:hypothetical protein